jgi:hypothetical protein
MIGANFQVLLDSIPPDLMRDVAELYRQEAAADALQCEMERAELGRLNEASPSGLVTGVGQVVRRVHATDYWAQQVIHRAPNDPDLWKWFLKTPEGAYARVRSDGPARIVVPDWKGGLWSSVAAGLAA